MADATDEMVREIAAKHGVAVGRDDPIMILLTMNERLAQENARAQQALLDQYKQEIEVLAARWTSAAKQDAERMLNVALGASRNLMREGAREAAASLRVEVDTVLNRVDSTLQQGRVVGVLIVVASCVTLIAVAMAVWAMH